MVDSAFGDFEETSVDAKQAKESVAFSEEKLYASDIFRMYCFKVSRRSRWRPVTRETDASRKGHLAFARASTPDAWTLR